MENVTIKGKIVEELKNMGFNFAHCGTTYLIDAVEIIYNSERIDMINCLEKNVYVLIGEKYNKKPRTIKSNITKATNFMHEQFLLEKKKTDKYYNLYPKMTAKSVINTVILKLKS